MLNYRLKFARLYPGAEKLMSDTATEFVQFFLFFISVIHHAILWSQALNT